MHEKILFDTPKFTIYYDNRHFIYGKITGYFAFSYWQIVKKEIIRAILEKQCSRLLIDLSELRGTWIPLLSRFKKKIHKFLKNYPLE